MKKLLTTLSAIIMIINVCCVQADEHFEVNSQNAVSEVIDELSEVEQVIEITDYGEMFPELKSTRVITAALSETEAEELIDLLPDMNISTTYEDDECLLSFENIDDAQLVFCKLQSLGITCSFIQENNNSAPSADLVQEFASQEEFTAYEEALPEYNADALSDTSSLPDADNPSEEYEVLGSNDEKIIENVNYAIYAITVETEGYYTFYTEKYNNVNCDTYLELYTDLQGTKIAYNDDFDNLYSQLQYTMQPGTAYYLKVRAFNTAGNVTCVLKSTTSSELRLISPVDGASIYSMNVVARAKNTKYLKLYMNGALKYTTSAAKIQSSVRACGGVYEIYLQGETYDGTIITSDVITINYYQTMAENTVLNASGVKTALFRVNLPKTGKYRFQTSYYREDCDTKLFILNMDKSVKYSDENDAESLYSLIENDFTPGFYLVKITADNAENNVNCAVKWSEFAQGQTSYDLINGQNICFFVKPKSMPHMQLQAFKLSYPADKLELIDSCIFTPQTETAVADLSEYGVKITKVESGTVTFIVNDPFLYYCRFYGVVNGLKFKAISDGNAVIECKTVDR
ncbi:MAG: hypothetical protein J6N52_02145 [Clostridia bacterium]|nr:hypothetical protein [Clostridia bacterium]